MKVVCTKLPPPPSGEVLDASPWVTVDAEYYVASVLAEPGGQVQIQVVADDGRSLAWFDSANFMTVDRTVPDRWSAQIGEGGVLELVPARPG